jgi:predicted phage terminase large subunit-like protein
MESEIGLAEAVELGAVDPNFYGRFFFPKACRQDSPPFHDELDRLLDSETDRFVDAMIARGFAKTTKLRVYISRRIAYRISKTIIVVGKSQDAASKTLEWIQRAVMYNPLYAETFGLSKGAKWTATDMEILAVTKDKFGNETGRIAIRILAMGITGSIRGINIDDYRPDLIVVDDPCDEENTATPEQRKKMDDLFFGALAKTLAPRVDSPFAKMVLLQTVLNRDDLISNCHKDKQWSSLKFSCFTTDPETGQEVSRWPERFPYEDLIADKQAHIDRNQLPLWLREMECKVTSEATAIFLERWLNYYELLPETGRRVICVDPTPPPAIGQEKKIDRKLDDAVIMVLQETKGQLYVVEVYEAISPDPLEFIYQIFSMARQWKVKLLAFETVLFQRVYAYFLKQEMIKERFWLTLKGIEDKRKKFTRIVQDVSGPASSGAIHVKHEHSKLIQQFIEYPDVNHDDHLDCLSIGIQALHKYAVVDDFLEGEWEELDDEEHDALPWQRGAP